MRTVLVMVGLLLMHVESFIRNGARTPLGRHTARASEPLAMHVFEITKSAEPWKYEDSIRSAVCKPGSMLVRWHIRGIGSTANTLSVEAVTFDPEVMPDDPATQ